MLETHVNNDIYNKYCLIHNNRMVNEEHRYLEMENSQYQNEKHFVYHKF